MQKACTLLQLAINRGLGDSKALWGREVDADCLPIGCFAPRPLIRAIVTTTELHAHLLLIATMANGCIWRGAGSAVGQIGP